MDYAKLLKKLISPATPEGVVLLAMVALAHWGPVKDSLAGFASFYSYTVFTAGILLGWRFHRSRLLFAMLVLALADRALLSVAVSQGTAAARGGGRVLFQAVAVLLPLNLAALPLTIERGFLNPTGLLRLAIVLAQVALVALLNHVAPGATAAVLHLKVLPQRLLAWTPLTEPALLAFGAGFGVLGTGMVLAPGPTKRTYLWALVAVFLGFNAYRAVPGPTLYFATAGLLLVLSVIEAHYHMAYEDGLTGLPARRALNEALLRLAGQYTVAMVDIDHFKDINDRYGHDVGDQVLRMVAAKVGHVSGGGNAFRYGGEEFALIFTGKTADDCWQDLETLRKTVEETTFMLRGRLRPHHKPDKPAPKSSRRRQVAITVSIGVAERNQRHDQPDQVIQAADRALYRAKEDGRNQVKK